MTRFRIILAAIIAGLAGVALAGAAGWHWNLPEGVAPPPVPIDNPMTRAKVELGRRLFYEADLSVDGTMSCATCHEQHRGFTDGNATRPGVHGDPGFRNIPGLANVAWMPKLTWADPRIRSLEEQVAIPVAGIDPIEMGMHEREGEIAYRLGRDACYVRMFRKAFPEREGQIDMATISMALASFQRTLISYQTPYDAWQRGDRRALSLPARDGLALFTGAGCAICHSGPNLTDAAFHVIAPLERGAADPGLAKVTGLPSDVGRFRTPSLRNVALTGPYLHDGSASSLAAAIRRHEAVELKEDQITGIVAFLGSLTDRAFVRDRRFSLPDRACGRKL